ncbi:MAG: alpha/beta hydrolase, partial [Myxococcota bacterium]
TPSPKRLLVFVAVAITGAYLVAMVAVFAAQRSLLYVPNPKRPEVPAGVLEVELTASDGTELLAWTIPEERSQAALLLHGNAGNRRNFLGTFYGFLDLGYRPFLLDYCGYGGSSGEPSEAGLYSDAEAAWKWLEDNGADTIVLWGYSLGTGVAVELATRHDETHVILDAPFDSATGVAARIYPWLPVSLLMLDRFDSLEKIGAIDSPLLIFHGDRDETIPMVHGRRLFEGAREPRRLEVITGAGHNDLHAIAGQNYWTVLKDFVRNTK